MQRIIPLLLINLLPVACVALFGWSAFILLFLYWAENVVVGIFTLVKMLIAGLAKGPWEIVPTLFYSSFFVVHYGIFCTVHGSLIWTFANGFGDDPDLSQLSALLIGQFLNNAVILTNLFVITAFHLYLFIGFWLLPGRWRKEKTNEIMASPYGRIIVIHLTILIGGFITVSLGEPLYMVFLLALLKTLMELGVSIASNLPGKVGALRRV